MDPGASVPRMMLMMVSADHVDSGESGGSKGDAVDGAVTNVLTIPAEADFLIANSTVPGKVETNVD